MCGINGFNWNDQGIIRAMNAAIKHRGPDDNGSYGDNTVSLGSVRLSIIDLSVAGHMPMSNEDESIWIVYNGEVYNFGEIRKGLETKHKFRSTTDTEVILHAYEEWGEKCVERFNGMWGFAIYDKKRNKLFLSRDRFGVKPVYYYWNGGKFIFSSEIKAILEHKIKRQPNDNVVYEFLALGMLEHRSATFFKDIHKLMPGENLVLDLKKKKLMTYRWYDLKTRIREIKQESEAQVEKKVRSLLTDSVRYRLIADVPVGSCLSGGIDSSSLVCLMRKLQENGEIKTFSLVFPGKKIDESKYQEEVVKQTHVEQFTVTFDQKDILRDIEDLVRTQEEPFGTLSMYGQYRVMKLTKENGIKVLLDGQGGDENFAGYFKYFDFLALEFYTKRQFGQMRKVMREAKERSYRVPSSIMLRPFMRGSRLGKRMVDRIRRNEKPFLAHIYIGDLPVPAYEMGMDLRTALLTDITKYSIPQLLRFEDKNSMRWSVESRVPFLDYRLVEYVAALRSDYKIRNGVPKYILRKAMNDIVPGSILARMDKLGFVTPDAEMFRSKEFKKFIMAIFNSKEFRSRKYWKQEGVLKIYEEHRSGKKDWAREIWRILNTEMWMRVFMD